MRISHSQQHRCFHHFKHHYRGIKITWRMIGSKWKKKKNKQTKPNDVLENQLLFSRCKKPSKAQLSATQNWKKKKKLYCLKSFSYLFLKVIFSYNNKQKKQHQINCIEKVFYIYFFSGENSFSVFYKSTSWANKSSKVLLLVEL